MDAKMVVAGTALLLLSSAVLVVSGTVTSPGPVAALSLSPLLLATLAYVGSSLDGRRPA
jgi:hypothetical protein